MELIVDANIMFAALIKDNHTRHLVLVNSGQLYLPEFFFEEIKTHLEVISEKANLSSEQIVNLLENFLILGNVQVVPLIEFQEFLKEAEKISPDPKDVPYLALALKMRCPLWSNDHDLKKQDRIKIISTLELINGEF